MANEKTVRVTIEVVNKAKGALAELSSETKKTTESLNKMSSDGKKTAQSVDSLGSSLKKLAIGYLSVKTLQMGFQELQESLKSQSIQQSFIMMADAADISSNKLVESLRNASMGTIATTDVMLSANRAMALGVGKNVEDMTKLMEIARLKGQAMGLDTTQAFDNIVTGIGRASPLILDNLGITIKQNEAQQLYAQKLGKSAEQLTDSEKKQALYNAVMEEGTRQLDQFGKVAVTPAERMQQMNALFADAKDSLFRGLIPAFESLSGGITDTAEDTEKYNKLMKDAAHAGFILGGTIEAIASALGIVGSGLSGFAKSVEGGIQEATSGFLKLATYVPGVSEDIDDLAEGFRLLGEESLNEAIDKGGDAADSFSNMGEAILEAATGFEEYYAEVEAAAQETDNLKKQTEEASQAQVDAEKVNESYKSSVSSLQSIYQSVGKELDTLNKQMDDLKKGYEEFIESTTEDTSKSLAQTVLDAEKAIPELKKQLKDIDTGDKDGRDKAKQLREEIKQNQEILKQAQSEEIASFEGFAEELAFLKEQDQRNELEQTLALFNRKMEIRKTEFEAEKKEIEDKILIKQDELNQFKLIQEQTSIVLEESVSARLVQVNKELLANEQLKSSISQLITYYTKLASVKSTGGSISGSGLSGARADGGPVGSGQSYLVGEKGPEIFTPNSNGVIIPNKGGATINIHIGSVRGQEDIDAIARAVEQASSRREELTSFGAR